MEPVQVADISLHIHGDLLPGLEAEVSLFQNGFVFLVSDAFDGSDNIPLQIHQPVDVIIDLMLKIHNLHNGIRHGGAAPVGVMGHTT